ncbi:MAG: hypothetical protein A2451_04725 [Bdellovibrionales bacterium RIFOXYC2_FULL_39_8]|nr:MAG: hypothetical protein A2451_04725 [Bdellovibrionales bacterium RIFOXYC2_FULL_39_8]
MGFRFAVGIKQDLLFSNLSKILSPALFTQLRNNSGNIPKTQMQIGRVLLDNLQKFEAAHDLALPAFDGSNAWVLSPWRSKSGGALLASDPHIGFSNPNIWYEAHVETPSWKLYGHFLPLIPFPVLGHNLDYGWAITIAYYDDMDLYRETISEDGRSVMFQERWVPLERYPQVIKVKGHSDFKFDLLITPHGPLLSSLFPKENISLKWTYYMEENATLEGLYKMGHAQNMEDFKQGVALGASPGLNILYADKIGNIGWWPMGAIPLRNKSDDGDLILDGASGVDEYIRYLEFREKPSSENPSSGVIISANQRPRNDSWGLRGYWPADNRYLSIDKMLMAQEKWSLEELKKVQTASFDVGIAHHLEILLRAINVEQMLNDTKNGESYRMVTRLLSNWDMRSEVDSAPAAIYHQTMRQALIFLLDELSSGEMMGGGMGPKEYCQLDAKDFFFNALLDDRESAWWDIKATSNIESRDDILRMAFAEALDFLRSRWGADPASWKWGALHTLEFTHPLGRKYPLNYIFNVGPLAVSGGANQINHYHDTGCESEFKVTAGASTRRLIDFYDATNSWGILPLGISGHILSKHYKDQLPLFIGGKYRSQWLERSSIEKNRESVLIFRAL